MLRLVRRPLFSILLLSAAGLRTLALAQDPPSAVIQPRPQIFSGFVTDFAPSSISVSRKNASGKDMVHKSFTMDMHTKVEGKIKLNSRVTVQFMPEGDSNRALRIIVRGG